MTLSGAISSYLNAAACYVYYFDDCDCRSYGVSAHCALSDDLEETSGETERIGVRDIRRSIFNVNTT